MQIGKKIGTYELIAKLGEGGMGEVCRARDTKLGRDVALKILPESFASDPDRLMRFEREAKTLASLNHPNIAAICGIEDPSTGSGQVALVMELVEGEDLSTLSADGKTFLILVPIDPAPKVLVTVNWAADVRRQLGVREARP
jgi:eukaryotic-like serine/threonine-protein kinase